MSGNIDLDTTLPYELDEETPLQTGLAWRKSALHCCWGKCNTDTRYPERSPPGTFFIPFPKIGRLKENMTEWAKKRENEKTLTSKRWVHACGRKEFTVEKIKKDTYICSLHFDGGKGPTDENPDPIKARPVSEENLCTKKSKRKLPTQRPSPVKKKKKKSTVEDLEIPASVSTNHDDLIDFNVDNKKGNENENHSLGNGENDKSTQTIYDKYILGAQIETIIMKNSLAKDDCLPSEITLHGNMSMQVILSSDVKSKYFIGLRTNQFWALYEWLGPAKFDLNYWGSKAKKSKEKTLFDISEELFVTLLRLRRGFNIFTLAHIYGTSETYIRKIFTTWIMFLYCHFRDYKNVMFSVRNSFDNKLTMPKVFRNFKNIRASIDCTEFRCEVPEDYSQQGNMYSSYKHHTTMKCMIAVNPYGAACFISDLYEGSITDEALFEDCGFLEYVNPGDSFLVDKGFNIQEKLLSKRATIFIPPFLGDRAKFTKEEVIQTKRIAKARIHVERFNERLKKFRLLDRVIPLNLRPLASQLVYVGCCLVNFQDCLCK